MKSTIINRPKTAVLAAIGGLLLAAFAAAPQAEASTIYACVKKPSGTARIVTGKVKCKKGESKLSWNTEGIMGKNGANGTNGTNGAAGANGATGANGTNGTNGTDGTNGAVGGFSVTHTGTEGVNFTTGSEGSPTTIVSRTLPAGNYIVNAKVELLLADSKTGGFASVNCKLLDAPSGGGAAASDSSTWATLINFPFIFFDLAQNTLPFSLAVNSASHSSTISVACYMPIKEANGGTLTGEANNAVITAVQTTTNS